jgi:hypothetical protein
MHIPWINVQFVFLFDNMSDPHAATKIVFICDVGTS